MSTPSLMQIEIRQVEERLRNAILSSDVTELDALIDDRLLFIGPDGGVYSKADDLELHRSSKERLTRFDLKEVLIELHGSTAIAVVRANLAGSFKGEAFEGDYRYTRTWLRGDRGWRIIAGACAALPK